MDQLFTQWMRKAGGQLDEARLNKLWEAAQHIAAQNAGDQFELVRYFFGLAKDSDIAAIVTALRKIDPLIATTSDQSKELTYLLGGAFIAAIEDEHYDAASYIGMSLLVASLYGARPGDYPREIIDFVYQKASHVRSMQIHSVSGIMKNDLFDKRVADVAAQVVPALKGEDFNKKLTLVLKALRNDTKARIERLQKKVATYSEESEFLWRTVTGYSEVAEKAYFAIELPARAILVGADFDVNGPSPIPADAAERLLGHLVGVGVGGGAPKAEQKAVTIQAAVNSIPMETRRKLCSVRRFQDVVSAYPLLRAIATSVAVDNDSAWGKVYVGAGGPDPKVKLTHQRLALQTMAELKLLHHSYSWTYEDD